MHQSIEQKNNTNESHININDSQFIYARFIARVCELMVLYGEVVQFNKWSFHVNSLSVFYKHRYRKKNSSLCISPQRYPLECFNADQTIVWFKYNSFDALDVHDNGTLFTSKQQLLYAQFAHPYLSLNNLINTIEQYSNRYIRETKMISNNCANHEEFINYLITIIASESTENDIRYCSDDIFYYSSMKFVSTKIINRFPNIQQTLKQSGYSNFSQYIVALQDELFSTCKIKSKTYICTRQSCIDKYYKKENSIILNAQKQEEKEQDKEEEHKENLMFARNIGSPICIDYFYENYCNRDNCSFDHVEPTIKNKKAIYQT